MNNKIKNKQILTDEQIKTLKEIGTCMIATCGNDKMPHCTIVEPSEFSSSQIIIPIVQMVTSVKNLKENDNVFLHFYYIHPEDSELNTQYKIQAKAALEFEGEDFERVKHYEEIEVLPEGFYVNGIIKAKLINMEVCVG